MFHSPPLSVHLILFFGFSPLSPSSALSSLSFLTWPCRSLLLPTPSGLCPSAPHRSWGKLLWGWFCGLSGAREPALSPAEKAALELKLTSIEEEPLWRRVCDINAVLLLAINVFLWGYFA